MSPATVARWLRRCASEPKDVNLILATMADFLMEERSENALVGIAAHVEGPQGVKIIMSPLVWQAS